MESLERCYLGEIGYYFQCKDCNQYDCNKICYMTKRKVEEHLRGFNEIFKINLEEIVEV